MRQGVLFVVCSHQFVEALDEQSVICQALRTLDGPLERGQLRHQAQARDCFAAIGLLSTTNEQLSYADDHGAVGRNQKRLQESRYGDF